MTTIEQLEQRVARLENALAYYARVYGDGEPGGAGYTVAMGEKPMQQNSAGHHNQGGCGCARNVMPQKESCGCGGGMAKIQAARTANPISAKPRSII